MTIQIIKLADYITHYGWTRVAKAAYGRLSATDRYDVKCLMMAERT